MCINMRKTKKLHKKKDKETNRYIWEVSLSSYVSLYTHIVRVFRPWILLILMLSLTYIERAYCAGETIGQKGDEKWGWPDKRSEEISRNRRSPFNVFDTVLLSLFVFFFFDFVSSFASDDTQRRRKREERREGLPFWLLRKIPQVVNADAAVVRPPADARKTRRNER